MSSFPPDHFLISSTISKHAFSSRRSFAYSSTLTFGARSEMTFLVACASSSSSGW